MDLLFYGKRTFTIENRQQKNVNSTRENIVIENIAIKNADSNLICGINLLKLVTSKIPLIIFNIKHFQYGEQKIKETQ